jgi:2-dehydro-3-deoxyphosphogluconate aldolase/(4S)-4-hydroxy-2-oxoglutarate aldolase
MVKILEEIGELALIPVVKIDNTQHATQLAEALISGGLPCAEITFRTKEAREVIQRIASAFPGILLGAGTVLSVDQAKIAIDSGAKFIVSPGFHPKVVDWCLEHKVPITPGVATPTEINMALDRNLHILKFFPAEALGGVGMLKAIAGPYGGVKFIPTGGVNMQNLADYIKLPMVHSCGGSWLAPPRLISAEEFNKITCLVQEAVELVRRY